MKAFLGVVLVVLSVAYVNGKPSKFNATLPVKFADCGSKFSKVSAVTVTPCDKEPCILHKGKNSTITVTFTVNSGVPNILSSKVLVHGVVAGIPFPFSLDNSDGCKDSGLTCPLIAGKTYTYSYTLPISSAYPSVSCYVKWELQVGDSWQGKLTQLETNSIIKKSNKSGDEIFCIEVPVVVGK